MTEALLESPVRTISIDQVGAGRALAFAIPLLERTFALSHLTKPSLTIYDPAPGKALARSREATTLGISARAVEQRGQDAIAAAGASDRLLQINVDHPETIAECLLLAAEHNRPTCVNVFVQLPSGALVAIRGAFAAEDRAGKIAAAAFFFVLNRVTVRAGSGKVWGPDAPPANITLEPAMRTWFTGALDRAHAMAAGVAPDGAPLECTYDGVDTMPLFIRDSRSGWADRETLEREVNAQTSTPLTRGTAFVIAEVGTDALQFVPGRFRALDRKVSVDAPEAVDAEHYDAAERAAHEAALRRAEEARLTRRNAAYATD